MIVACSLTLPSVHPYALMRRSIFIRSRSTRLGAKDFLWRYVAAAQQRSSSLRSSARKHSSQPPPSCAECGGSIAFFSSIPVLGCTILCHSDTFLCCSVLRNSARRKVTKNVDLKKSGRFLWGTHCARRDLASCPGGCRAGRRLAWAAWPCSHCGPPPAASRAVRRWAWLARC